MGKTITTWLGCQATTITRTVVTRRSLLVGKNKNGIHTRDNNNMGPSMSSRYRPTVRIFHSTNINNNIQKEKAALLRALQVDEKDNKKKNIKKKGMMKVPSGKGISKNGFGNDNNKSSPQNSSKKLTMDEFFANLSKSNNKNASQPRRGSLQEEQNVFEDRGRDLEKEPLSSSSSSIEARTNTFMERLLPTGLGRRGTSPPRADMKSFFDEVTALVEKNKALQRGTPTTSLSSPSPSSSSSSSLNPRTSLPALGTTTSQDDTASSTSAATTVGLRPSIFDMLPPPVKERGPNAYEEDAFHQYTELLELAMESPKFLRKHTRKPLLGTAAESVVAWLRAEEPTVKCNLPLLQRAIEGTLESQHIIHRTDEKSTTKDSKVSRPFRKELSDQQKAFMDHLGWDEKQYNIAVGVLRNMGEVCAQRATAPPLDIAWQKLKEAGYKMDKDCLHTYLYVSSTFSLRSARRLSSVRSVRSVLDFLDGIGSSAGANEAGQGTKQQQFDEGRDKDDEGIHVAVEAAYVHDMLYESTEQSISILVRMLVSQGKAKEAERLLDSSMKSEELRLRTYAPVYQAYLDQGDVSSAFKLFLKMKHGENVVIQPETYMQLIACAAENGYFRNGACEIEGIKELGYPDASGPALFDSLVSELAEIAVEINSAAAKRLYSTFQSGFQGDNPHTNLKALHLLEPLKGNNDPADPRDLIVSRVRIDENTGRCPRSSTQLRLIHLDSEQKSRFRDGLLYLATNTFENRHQTKDLRAEKSLNDFGTWLKDRSGKPFTAIIDGPNIAYYMQNFEQGTFNYHQIKFVKDALEDMGENVLVILPYKYTQDSFILNKMTRSVRQKLSKKERAICDDLISSGKAYVVPSGCLDDYYWMYASVSMDEEYVEPGNEQGRWPGTRPMLISNDKLRDHQMSLLEPRLFRRWYSNFLVNLTFSAFVGEECVDREIGFRTADFYSREIQGNKVLDDEGIESGTVWHFPVSDWDDNESLCIRIPTKGMCR